MDTSNETTMIKFLDAEPDAPNDISVTKFLQADTTVSKENVNMTVIQFLEDLLLDQH